VEKYGKTPQTWLALSYLNNCAVWFR